MLSSRFLSVVFVIFLLSGCRVESLNTTSGTNPTIERGLSALSIAPVKTRIAQQVRNELLFSLRGGNQTDIGPWLVELDVTSKGEEHSVLIGVRGPTAAYVEVNVAYRIVEKSSISTGSPKLLFRGERQALAGYDLTPQNFANQRARQDAENRAAKTAARLVRLALAQNLVKLSTDKKK